MKTTHVLQLVLLSAVWGMSFILISIAGSSFPPFWVALMRSSFGAAFLWIVLIAGRHQLPPRKLFGWLFLVALFNNAIPFTFFAWGERTVPSSTASILNATTPIWTLLLTLGVQRAHATRSIILGVLLGFSGVVLVVYGHNPTQSSAITPAAYLRGVVFISAATLCYGIATLMAKLKLHGLDPVGLATTQLSLSSMMLIPVAFAGPHPSALRPASVAAMIFLGIAGSGFAYLIYYSLLAHISATHVVAVTYLIPIWGLLWGYLAHESVGWTAYVGVVIVIAGLVLLNFRAFRAVSPPAPIAYRV
jgi:drug/metabolite transporter (DMT)-like permease